MSFLLGALCACQLAAAAPAERPLTAQELVSRARSARYQQDSALSDYHAIARQRWSGGIGLAAAGGLGPLGRMRLAARFETVAKMGWHHERGAWAELLAARSVAPIVGDIEAEPMDSEMAFTIPYYPGRDRLWPMDEMLEAMPGNGGWIAHPLDAGSDSLYRFTLGGPLNITLPDGKQINLRELNVRPVRPDARLIVGSLWLDVSNGALVRAAYRPSVAMDLWPYMRPNFDGDDEEMIKRFGPFRGNVEEIVVEHGLYAGQFWLPRIRIAHAEGTAKGGRVTISIEQTFEYERVRALAPGEVQAPQVGDNRRDDRDYYRGRGSDYYEGTSRRGTCRETGDSTSPAFTPDSLSRAGGLRTRTLEGVRLRVLLPCDFERLVNSPLLPTSIYEKSDELFTDHDLSRLREETKTALALSKQAEWEPQKPTIRWGIDDGLLRYNRIEGLSAGVRRERQLGKGYASDATLRFGVADLEPNGEIALRRRHGHGELRAIAYRRLDATNEWGNPLGLSSSLSALILGRDDGLYYRSMGAELGGTFARISSPRSYSWRLFAEQHENARVENTFSFARIADGSDFAPNITTTRGNFAGAGLAMAFAHGLDPAGTQVSGGVKAEGAAKQDGIGYGRAFGEVRLGRSLMKGVLGSLTGAAGSSVGDVPAERMWYLGGAHTIHAHRPGAAGGDAFWMARAELTKGLPLIRPILFADMGWAGPRDQFTRSERRLLAAGFGAAALDGLVRFDVSRAMDASNRWSFDIFLEVR